MTSSLGLLLMGAAAVVLVAFSIKPRKQEERDVLTRRLSGKSGKDETGDIREKARQSVTSKMMEKVAPLAMRPVMPKNGAEMTQLRMKLAAAGFRAPNAPSIFLASKTVVGILCAVGVAIYTIYRGAEIHNILGMAIFGAALGFMAPNMWLSSGMKKRGGKITEGLPDALDLMVISVESGLALDGALQRVGDELCNVHVELSEEFQIATRESQMGIPRAEALSNLADRTRVPEVKSLVAVVNQAEKFGTSIARALRNQASALRVKRRQAAEERAQKVAVKLMLPLILFIFPAIFVVLVGPAAMRMYNMTKTSSLF